MSDFIIGQKYQSKFNKKWIIRIISKEGLNTYRYKTLNNEIHAHFYFIKIDSIEQGTLYKKDFVILPREFKEYVKLII